MKIKKEVDSGIYQRGYYVKAFDGKVEKYLESLRAGETGNRFDEVFRRAGLKEGERVLDVGCGRGELIYFSILRGASRAVGVDYSKDALAIAEKAIGLLPPETRKRALLLCSNVSNLGLDEQFDCCFLTDIVEHLTDEQLSGLFLELKKRLSDKGRLIIHTAPNVNWIRFEYPIKRFLTIPSTVIKRLRGKKPYKAPEGAGFFRKVLNFLDMYYARDYYSYSLDMHINEQSPASLKRHLRCAGFDYKLWCEDGSSNIISIICKRFWGPDIWAVARKKN
ncbi:MAG: class I SAM-dependent methyltransferase [Candidatus Omnitrophica bacterium]|nr:class I SAM-dependent methyltransferase [Candidatus Omnitrophota bacterium]